MWYASVGAIDRQIATTKCTRALRGAYCEDTHTKKRGQGRAGRPPSAHMPSTRVALVTAFLRGAKRQEALPRDLSGGGGGGTPDAPLKALLRPAGGSLCPAGQLAMYNVN
jgi:hypothetical protein